MKLFEVVKKRAPNRIPLAAQQWANLHVDAEELKGDQPEYTWLIEDYLSTEASPAFKSVYYHYKKKLKTKKKVETKTKKHEPLVKS